MQSLKTDAESQSFKKQQIMIIKDLCLCVTSTSSVHRLEVKKRLFGGDSCYLKLKINKWLQFC